MPHCSSHPIKKTWPRQKEKAINSLAAAVAGGGTDALSLADLDTGFRVVGGRGAHTLLNLASHGQESLLDIAGVLGGSLQERDSQAVGEFLEVCQICFNKHVEYGSLYVL